MKKIPDIGTIFVLTMVFLIIFDLIHLFLVRINSQGVEVLVYAVIASWAWLYWPRGKEEL